MLNSSMCWALLHFRSFSGTIDNLKGKLLRYSLGRFYCSRPYLENIGGAILGMCRENTSNMCAAYRLAQDLVWLGYMAHTTKSLNKDFWVFWSMGKIRSCRTFIPG